MRQKLQPFGDVYPSLPEDFGVTIDITLPEGADLLLFVDKRFDHTDPGADFRIMADFLDAYIRLEQAIVSPFLPESKISYEISNVDTGSLKAFIRRILENLSDEGLKERPAKEVFGAFLIESRDLILNLLSEDSASSSTSNIRSLWDNIKQIAERCGIDWIPPFDAIDADAISESGTKFRQAQQQLPPSGKLVIIGHNDSKEIPKISSEIFGEDSPMEICEETEPASLEFLIKKVDLLGSSQWEVFWNKTRYYLKILDLDWLRKFHDRGTAVSPADTILGKTRYKLCRRPDGTVYAKDFEMIEVERVGKASGPLTKFWDQ